MLPIPVDMTVLYGEDVMTLSRTTGDGPWSLSGRGPVLAPTWSALREGKVLHVELDGDAFTWLFSETGALTDLRTSYEAAIPAVMDGL